jgi:hypothetical protein
VVLGNLNGSAPDEIAAKLDDLAEGRTASLAEHREEVSVSPAVLEKYVGTYEMTPDSRMTVTLKGARLVTHIDGYGQIQAPLYAESQSRFFLKMADIQIDFVLGAGGEVIYLVLHQHDNDLKAARVNDPAGSPRSSPVIR